MSVILVTREQMVVVATKKLQNLSHLYNNKNTMAAKKKAAKKVAKKKVAKKKSAKRG